METDYTCLVCNRHHFLIAENCILCLGQINCTGCNTAHYIKQCTSCSQRIVTLNDNDLKCSDCKKCNLCNNSLSGLNGKWECLHCITKRYKNSANRLPTPKLSTGLLICVVHEVYKNSYKLDLQEQKIQSLTNKIDALTQKLEHLFMYHPIIGSEIPKAAASFTENANKNI